VLTVIGGDRDTEAGINGRISSLLRPLYRPTSARVCLLVCLSLCE